MTHSAPSLSQWECRNSTVLPAVKINPPPRKKASKGQNVLSIPLQICALCSETLASFCWEKDNNPPKKQTCSCHIFLRCAADNKLALNIYLNKEETSSGGTKKYPLCSTNVFRSKRFCGGQKFYILNIANVASWLHITGIVLYKESPILTGCTAYSFPRGKQWTYNRRWKAQCPPQHNSALCCLPTPPCWTLLYVQLVLKVEYPSLRFVQVPWHISEEKNKSIKLNPKIFKYCVNIS